MSSQFILYFSLQAGGWISITSERMCLIFSWLLFLMCQSVCAYSTIQTIQTILWHRLQLSGPEKENVKKEAMRLSLKYNFVTPHTSMVVTKPTGENTDVLHKPKEGQTSQQWDRAQIPPSFVQHYGHVAASPPMLLPGAPGMKSEWLKCVCFRHHTPSRLPTTFWVIFQSSFSYCVPGNVYWCCQKLALTRWKYLNLYKLD